MAAKKLTPVERLMAEAKAYAEAPMFAVGPNPKRELLQPQHDAERRFCRLAARLLRNAEERGLTEGMKAGQAIARAVRPIRRHGAKA